MESVTKIPFFKEISGDLETPLSIYLKFMDDRNSYLFESVEGGEKWARYSIIGLPTDKKIDLSKNPLKDIENFLKQNKSQPMPDLPDFHGGLVGYFSYETIRHIEKKLQNSSKEKLPYPDISLMVSDEVVIYDNLKKSLFIVVHGNEDTEKECHERIELIHKKILEPLPSQKASKKGVINFESSVKKEDYLEAIKKIKNYIVEGDVMQVVYGQEFSTKFEGSPIDLYRSLRKLNPSPYMYLMKIDDLHIVGASPEILVRLQNEEVTVRPIAGTVKRGKDSNEDEELADKLKSDPKEIAEHLMLIDLGRNDVGRIAEVGSVKTTEEMKIEKYSHVMHLVSNVVGKIKKGLTSIDVLKATFPAGTLSGAPKIRAMEIIDELEPDRRGVYGGAVGYLSWTGNMDVAIAIRTAVIQGKNLSVRAGGGIVYDSDPESEYQESLNKAMSIMKAVEEMD
ncbi:MAG: anthranilate synthase component I [Pseudomonadota bacterium]|jgi:anthranilate synthase component 1|nr:anthranilate synthase component I [Pseudomonadota bacterium]